MREYSARMEHMMYTPVTLPVTNEYGYFEIRLESIGGLGANLCGKMLGELGALYPVSYTHLTLPTNREV